MEFKKKILLAFSSKTSKDLLTEIFVQLNPTARVEYAVNDLGVLHVLSRQPITDLPGLIVFDSPPVTREFARFVDALEKQWFLLEIPIAIFVPVSDISVMASWLRYENIHLYPGTSTPSECKFLMKRILGLYTNNYIAQ